MNFVTYEDVIPELRPLNRTKLKHNQGDIFALQLRGHIAFAKTRPKSASVVNGFFRINKFGKNIIDGPKDIPDSRQEICHSQRS